MAKFITTKCCTMRNCRNRKPVQNIALISISLKFRWFNFNPKDNITSHSDCAVIPSLVKAYGVSSINTFISFSLYSSFSTFSTPSSLQMLSIQYFSQSVWIRALAGWKIRIHLLWWKDRSNYRCSWSYRYLSSLRWMGKRWLDMFRVGNEMWVGSSSFESGVHLFILIRSQRHLLLLRDFSSWSFLWLFPLWGSGFFCSIL